MINLKNLIILFSFISVNSFAQWTVQEQITTFGSKIKNPIKLQVEENNGAYRFIAHNKSLYPYRIELNFTVLQNLQPFVKTTTIVANSGKTTILNLKKQNESSSANYEYSYSYKIAGNNKECNNDFPYLFPIGKGNVVSFVTTGKHANIHTRDAFKLTSGDTVYCVRKGIVTAIPDMYEEVDRFSNSYSLEIKHDDGSIIIINGVDLKNTFVKYSQTVYPGQPLGLVDKYEKVTLDLYHLDAKSKLNRKEIKYYLNEKPQAFSMEFRNAVCEYPFEIITSEMRRREIKKFKKNKLY